MSDRDWREAERAWQADPQDQTRYDAAIAARRRAGVPISGALLEDLIHPPRTIESQKRLMFALLSVQRELRHLGETPGRLEIPRHRSVVVASVDVDTLLAERRRLRLPGLLLHRRDLHLVHAALPTLERLEQDATLEFLQWVGLSEPAELRHLPGNLVRLALLESFAQRPDWSHSLPRLEHLTELWLSKGTPLESITLAALARLPNLRRIHVPSPTRLLRGQVHEALPDCRLASA